MNTESKPKKPLRLLIGLVVAVVLAAFLFVEYQILSFGNQQQAFRTANDLSQQVLAAVNRNANRAMTLTEAKKEEYVAKIREFAYLFELVPDLNRDRAELRRAAERLGVDELLVLDEAGRVYAGTTADYEGLTLEEGQLSVFMPLLMDKKLSMCRDLALMEDGETLRCTIAWNDSGDTLLLIGLSQQRLQNSTDSPGVQELIASMPVYGGVEILVADKDSREILGATHAARLGQTLESQGITAADIPVTGANSLTGVMDGKKTCFTVRNSGKRLIVIAQELDSINRNIPGIMISIFVYLVVVAAAIIFLMLHMTERITDEHKNANTDTLTGLLNRRAYEDELVRLRHNPECEKLTVVSLDLNGLKTANDTRGHEMGDALICALSENMIEAFHRFGKLYRTGGDEFMALLQIEDSELKQAIDKLNNRIEAWTKVHNYRLSVALGYVHAKDHPGLDAQELAALADKEMYEAKARYYQTSGHDRRKN